MANGKILSHILAAMLLSVQASGALASAAPQPFKLKPLLSIQLYDALGEDSYLGDAQVLLPVFGGLSQVLYMCGEGYVDTDHGKMASIGLGYRKVMKERIYGAFLIANKLASPNNSFWVISPGFEILSDVWNFDFNIYIPVEGKKTIEDQNGEQNGGNLKPNKLSFFRQNAGDEFKTAFEEAGKGVDFEAGRALPYFENGTIYVGAYHFNTDGFGSLGGLRVRLTYDFSQHMGFEIDEQYDNRYHNQFLISLYFTFGGYSGKEADKYGISTRLTETVSHVPFLLSSED